MFADSPILHIDRAVSRRWVGRTDPMGTMADHPSKRRHRGASSGSIGSWASFPALPTGSRMTGVVQGTATCSNSAGRERFSDIPARLFLPVAAFASLLLGLGLLLDPLGPTGTYIPLVLFAIGLGAMAAYVFLDLWRNVPAPSGGPGPAAPVVAASTPTDSRTVAGSGPTDRPGASITGRGSEWRVLSAPASPGDETWLSWLPREHQRLGPERTGFASAVVPSPGRAGNLVAFPVPNYFHGVRSVAGSGEMVDPMPLTRPRPDLAETNDSTVSPTNPRTPGGRGTSRSSVRARLYSEEELDRMFPPTSGHPYVVLSDAPERVGGMPSWKTEPGTPAGTPARLDDHALLAKGRSYPLGGDGHRKTRLDPFEEPSTHIVRIPESTTSASSSSLDDASAPNDAASRLSLEASNPLPPHLRDAGGPPLRVNTQRSARRPVDPERQRSVCASCSKVVVNLHMSGPCPRCLRPICNDCLREALVHEGHGWCLDCSSAPAVRTPEPAGGGPRGGTGPGRNDGPWR